MQDIYTGIVAFMLFVLFPTHIERFAGGLQRAFAFPLLIIFFYYLCRFRIDKCAFLIMLQILFYPVISVLSFVALIFALAFSSKKVLQRYSSKQILLYTLLPFVLAVTFIYIKQITKPQFLGELISKEEMYRDLTFFEGGRDPYLPIRLLSSVIIEKFLLHTKFWFLISLCVVPLLQSAASPKRKTEKGISTYPPIFFLLFSSILLYKLASVLLFKIYMPERYTDFSLPLIHILLVSKGAGVFVSALKTKPLKIALVVIFFFFALRMSSLVKV